MKSSLLREITPLTPNDCFTIFSRTKVGFDFPIHYHEEFELNFIQHARGARRVIGDHIGEIDDVELVLIGPNLQHGWFTHKSKSDHIQEITIQFHRDLFDEKFLQRNQMNLINSMFNRSLHGVLFSQEVIKIVAPVIAGLIEKQGFESVLSLMSILHELSVSRNMKTLSDRSFSRTGSISYNSRRINRIMEHINNNFGKTITLNEVSKLAGMTEVSFSRFFRQRTGKSFIDTVNEVRLGHASRMLIETTQTINEVALECGFNNISNFNRIFKKKKICTPKQFRKTYNASGTRTFV